MQITFNEILVLDNSVNPKLFEFRFKDINYIQLLLFSLENKNKNNNNNNNNGLKNL